MERYTKLITKDNDGYDYAMVKKQQYVIDCNFDASNISVTAVNRSSEEGCLYKHYYASGNAVDKLAEYENAEEQGLLTRLPCKVGDNIYTLNSMSNTGIEIIECKQIRFNKNSTMFRGGRCKYQNSKFAFWAFDLKDYKITWFTTQYEALEALKQRE